MGDFPHRRKVVNLDIIPTFEFCPVGGHSPETRTVGVSCLDQTQKSVPQPTLQTQPVKTEVLEYIDVDPTTHQPQLRRLQLIRCPDSWSHEQESRISGINADLKKMYEQFSGGISFDRLHDIEALQICDAYFGIAYHYMQSKLLFQSMKCDF
jgi:hypothetical protein